VVGAAAGELDGMGSLVEVTEEVVVEEFGAVIAVEAAEVERERGFDVMDLFPDGGPDNMSKKRCNLMAPLVLRK